MSNCIKNAFELDNFLLPFRLCSLEVSQAVEDDVDGIVLF